MPSKFDYIYKQVIKECRMTEEDCGTVCASQCSSTGLSAFAPQNIVSVAKNKKEDDEDEDILI